MPRRNRVVSSLLVLACASSTAWASKKEFNIHDDLLAVPQFEVRFPDDYVLESQARDLLQDRHDSASTFADSRENSAQVYLGHGNHDTDQAKSPWEGDGDFGYEEMLLGDQRFLCQIPRVQVNERVNATGKPQEADEQKELARAMDRGLELLREMEGKCMYYISGWWSYSFCYKNQIKQFHALPSGSGIPNYPPTEDQTTHSFILGRFPQGEGEDEEVEGDSEHKHTSTDVAELQTKGGSRYLVQRLDGGTRCDLTGRNRKIEVQFHCHPQSTDRIGWIKELTTCSYLMVIYTPRLCNDVAFLPPQQDEVHGIDCREILSPEQVPDWEAIREYQLAQRLVESAVIDEFPVVGDIQVGAQKLVGSEGKEIEKGRVAWAGEERIDVVAKRENGEVYQMSREDLKKYDLDPEKLEALKKRLEEWAKGKDWTLEVIEINGERQLRGLVDEDEEEEEGVTEGEGSQEEMIAEAPSQETGEAESQEQEAPATPETRETADTPEEQNEQPSESDGVEEVSERVLKDEL
ncbi:PRKCSH domain-containing protein [Aspergillus ibericus CBS 121593]|uniref:Endoplasmic reticulum lectin n=1 Tax=Aspergillus ibericus CBS 121593 TaxID=1448316 RepID=A0A395H142_9EURO|nr:misfolded glyco proteins degradation protein Yos9 [Aspergillus ibericus CBS 121593]RAL01572.1 misfolded glyco proteins degradation protein Yos9 [Aspergillus ibericus CBS 121593]